MSKEGNCFQNGNSLSSKRKFNNLVVILIIENHIDLDYDQKQIWKEKNKSL